MKFNAALKRVKQDSRLMMRRPEETGGDGLVWREGSVGRSPGLFSVKDHRKGGRIAICDLQCTDQFHDHDDWHKELVRKDWEVVEAHLLCSACGHAL